MLTFEMQLSGEQVGSGLRSEPEELAYALISLAENEGPAADEMTGFFDAEESEAVIAMLRGLIAAIEAA